MKSHLQSALAAAVVVGTFTVSAAQFDWNTITPSRDLEYYDCFDSFKCARLLLPLDWLDEKSNETIAMAVIKSDAVVGIDDPTYAGPVLSNPGGPGGPGVQALLGSAALQRELVDTPGKKHFEYVSFDPRGIGATTPVVNCFPDSQLERAAVAFKSRGSGGLNGGPASLPYGLGLAAIEGDRCAQYNGDLLRYVGTTSVARDMVAIVDKIDEYNKKNMNKQDSNAKNVTPRNQDLPRLQYLGFSYGTVIGSYLASLFPERVGRLLLDGVFDINDYANGDGWLTNTADTDQMVDLFFKGCFNAGKDSCPLYHQGDKSASDISKRVWDWTKGLDETPTLASQGDQAVVLQSADIRLLLLTTMYRPLQLFKATATQIEQAMQGNTTSLYSFVSGSLGGPLQNGCSVTKPPPALVDSQSAILCGDGEDITGRNTTFWRNYLQKQLTQSVVAGANWANFRVSCSNWKTRAKWQFHGPFTAPEPCKNATAPESGRPAAPILFLSNRFDPVTPLRGARKMTKQYPGSGLLIQEGMGHTVFSQRAATDCTKNIVRRYFDKGAIPSNETTCKIACDPWGPKCNFTGSQSTASSASESESDAPATEFYSDWRFPLHM